MTNQSFAARDHSINWVTVAGLNSTTEALHTELARLLSEVDVNYLDEFLHQNREFSLNEVDWMKVAKTIGRFEQDGFALSGFCDEWSEFVDAEVVFDEVEKRVSMEEFDIVALIDLVLENKLSSRATRVAELVVISEEEDADSKQQLLLVLRNRFPQEFKNKELIERLSVGVTL